MAIVTISPFEPPEIEDELIQEIPIDETTEKTRNMIFILLGIVWLFFIARMSWVFLTGRYKPSIRKR